MRRVSGMAAMHFAAACAYDLRFFLLCVWFLTRDYDRSICRHWPAPGALALVAGIADGRPRAIIESGAWWRMARNGWQRWQRPPLMRQRQPRINHRRDYRHCRRAHQVPIDAVCRWVALREYREKLGMVDADESKCAW